MMWVVVMNVDDVADCCQVRFEVAHSPFVVLRSAPSLKAQLLEACGGQSLGAEAGAEGLRRVRDLSGRLAALTPTADPASSPLLCGTWDIVWTTESALLALTKRGLLGLPCTAAYQAIARTREGGAGPCAYSPVSYTPLTLPPLLLV